MIQPLSTLSLAIDLIGSHPTLINPFHVLAISPDINRPVSIIIGPQHYQNSFNYNPLALFSTLSIGVEPFETIINRGQTYIIPHHSYNPYHLIDCLSACLRDNADNAVQQTRMVQIYSPSARVGPH